MRISPKLWVIQENWECFITGLAMLFAIGVLGLISRAIGINFADTNLNIQPSKTHSKVVINVFIAVI